jgi:GNAT superfamily N-acetyltransferase
MADAEESFKKPFVEHGYDPNRIFYFGESVLRKLYRGLGLGVRFFQEREAYAEHLGRFDWITFCAVERPENHPRRPPDYIPLDRFWKRRGYAQYPELRTSYVWQELDETEATPKPMVFWLKGLHGGGATRSPA